MTRVPVTNMRYADKGAPGRCLGGGGGGGGGEMLKCSPWNNEVSIISSKEKG